MSTSRRALSHWAAACLALPLLACQEPPQAACTLIGCDSGVTVQLSTLPAVPFSVELTAFPGGESTLKQCTADGACSATLFFEGVRADSVSIKVTSGTGETITGVKPAYSVTRPNGPQCDPECRQASVSVNSP